MNRVTTSGNYSSVLANLMAAQSRQLEAGEQVSSQKKAFDLKGYGRDAETLTAMRSVQTRVGGYIEQTAALSDKLTVQDLALGQLGEAAMGARDAITNALAAGRGETLMQELSGAFADVVQALNTKNQGRYLFSGGQVDVRPVSATGMGDLTSVTDVADFFHNDQFKAANQIDDGVSVQTGFLASELGTGLFQVFQALQAFNDGPDGPVNAELTDAQRAFLSDQVAALNTQYETTVAASGLNGLNQNRVESVNEDLERRQDTLETMVSDVSAVDMADAVSRLQQAQLSVQAAAQVFSTLQNSSLLNLLPR